MDGPSADQPTETVAVQPNIEQTKVVEDPF